MNHFYDQAGARIRQLREMNRYTREKFAEIADISPKFLYEIETGQKGFSADTLYRIAKGLSVNCEYILTGEKQEPYQEDVLRALKMFEPSQMGIVKQMLTSCYELSTKKGGALTLADPSKATRRTARNNFYWKGETVHETETGRRLFACSAA